MKATLTACVLKGSSLLRYFRLLDKHFNRIIIFAFPSILSKSCIVKIELTFQNLQIFYHFFCNGDIQEGLDSIKNEGMAQKRYVPVMNGKKNKFFY